MHRISGRPHRLSPRSGRKKVARGASLGIKTHQHRKPAARAKDPSSCPENSSSGRSAATTIIRAFFETMKSNNEPIGLPLSYPIE